ncbi:MAG: sigma 54-interacting transcriptional regulator [Myxococcales bacterium]|nr:sigma 54-interacting transcriptional regulator [Myxococcales bacterium]
MSSASTSTSPRRAARAGGVFRLLVLYAPGSQRPGQSSVLERPLLISREEGEGGARFVLDDSEVSRRHADLSSEGEDWVLVDEGSHNGSFVNGERVRRVRLAAGDVIRVGQHVLLLQHLDLAASQRLARRRLPDSPLVGDGPAIKAVDEQLSACAKQGGPVLVLGESGTGKELVAQQLHALSGRQGKLVPVNCTALGEQVADSELFGHVKGAFSGALRTTMGLFGEARGGTLLLDELGDMPLELQAKLLRTLETGEVRRVGSATPEHVDTRVVAATHVDLEAAVEAGTFRGDLWARLQRHVIRLPPLRERREDVLPIARHVLQGLRSRHTVTSDAAEALLAHDWPYNVRELRNVIESACEQARGRRAIDLEHLPEALVERLAARMDAPATLPVGRPPESAQELRALLAQHGGNVAKLAELLGKDRKQIYRWCERFGVDPGERP